MLVTNAEIFLGNIPHPGVKHKHKPSSWDDWASVFTIVLKTLASDMTLLSCPRCHIFWPKLVKI
jgi:hypothetical protein